MQNQITLAELEELMEEINVSTYDGAGGDSYLTTDYSGRGMYGDRCVGVIGNPAEIMFGLGMHLGELVANEDGTHWWDLAESLRSFRLDSMGLSTIIYWPELSVEAAEGYPLGTEIRDGSMINGSDCLEDAR